MAPMSLVPNASDMSTQSERASSFPAIHRCSSATVSKNRVTEAPLCSSETSPNQNSVFLHAYWFATTLVSCYHLAVKIRKKMNVDTAGPPRGYSGAVLPPFLHPPLARCPRSPSTKPRPLQFAPNADFTRRRAGKHLRRWQTLTREKYMQRQIDSQDQIDADANRFPSSPAQPRSARPQPRTIGS